MPMADLIRCDQCGQSATRDDAAKSWFQVQSRLTLRDYYRVPERKVDVDLCSWRCVGEYGAIQAAEPELQQSS